MQIIEIVLLLILVYTWAGYYLLLVILGRLTSSRTKYFNCQEPQYPRIAILFSAYNEEKVIQRKLENALEAIAEYNKLSPKVTANQIWVGIDGATDTTARIALEFSRAHPEIRVVEFNMRRGKTAVLKALVSLCTEDEKNKPEILVFTDANTMFQPHALERLVQPFSDPAVGCVCGRLRLVEYQDKKQQLNTELFYWQDESCLKEMESNLDSCTSVNGGIYAIRTHLFWKDIPDNTIVDDFVIGMKVREKGYRIRFVSDAVGEEFAPPDWKSWWRRRVRIGTGNYQALWLCRKCLLPTYGKFAWMFWSHKVLRWFTPHIILGLFVINLLDCVFSFWWRTWSAVSFLRCMALAMIILTVLAGRLLSRPVSLFGRLIRIFSDFIVAQIALLYGFWKVCTGNIKGWWEPTAR
jgi:cellulose synthase/poly-beta-1,6-N-acetylglucosamine synthase-like glycosyltransferase